MASILVIDDDEVLLSLTRALLHNVGHTVFTTADGPRGIEIYRTSLPDLVLLDIGLPTASGLEVLEQIVALHADARVVMISGYGAAETIAQARRLGALDFLEKPFLNEDLSENHPPIPAGTRQQTPIEPSRAKRAPMPNPDTQSLYNDLFSTRASRALAFGGISVVLLLAISHVLAFIFDAPIPASIRFQISLDGEGNLAMWVNALLLLSASMAALVVARYLGTHSPSQGHAPGWILTGLTFLYLATDEAAQLHDVFSVPIARITGRIFPAIPPGMLWYAWIPVFALLGITATVILVAMLRRSLFRCRNATILAACGFVCFMANPVLEILENRHVDILPPHLLPSGPAALIQYDHAAWDHLQSLIVLEEGLEMIGALCFVLGFLRFGRHLFESQNVERTPP